MVLKEMVGVNVEVVVGDDINVVVLILVVDEVLEIVVGIREDDVKVVVCLVDVVVA